MIYDKQQQLASKTTSLLSNDNDKSNKPKRARQNQDKRSTDDDYVRELIEALDVETLRKKDSATLDTYYSQLSQLLNNIEQAKEEQELLLNEVEIASEKHANNEILAGNTYGVEQQHQHQQQHQQPQKTQKLNAEHDYSHQRSKLGEALNNTSNNVLFQVFGFLNVITVDKKRSTCQQWRDCCEKAIDSRGKGLFKKSFESNEELCDKVYEYVEGDCDNIEAIAEEYGYPIGKWNVSRITDFSSVCAGIEMNEDISTWNMSNAVDLDRMFYSNTSFNHDISSWNTSNVRKMHWMFAHASSFNQDLSSWNVSSVTNMNHMFYNATTFNQDLRSWELSTDVATRDMFNGATSFNPEFLPSRRIQLCTTDVGL